jgi:plastocyanin
MLRKLLAVALALAGLGASACSVHNAGSGNGGGVETVMLPPLAPDLVVFATVPRKTIGEELPSEGLGTYHSDKWNATFGGFTQETRSQALGFKPNTKLTIVNLSHDITHTLDVVKEIKGPPADFPANPKLSISAQGHGKLETGYASGPIKPRKSVTVTLVKAGIYLIGCAFHYHEGMRDVLVVEPDASPGPQGTPPPSPTSSPTSRNSYAP